LPTNIAFGELDISSLAEHVQRGRLLEVARFLQRFDLGVNHSSSSLTLDAVQNVHIRSLGLGRLGMTYWWNQARNNVANRPLRSRKNS
jgi:hypothetical protein